MKTDPITPPPELVQQWADMLSSRSDQAVFTMAAQWGAKQELEACIDVLGGQWEWDALSQCTGWKEFRHQSEEILRTSRRPALSLKEQALAVITNAAICDHLSPEDEAIFRRALEALPND